MLRHRRPETPETDERPTPIASVIICTHERPAGLVSAVASALANTSSAFELVVDQRATPIAHADLREHVDDPRLHYVHSETRGLSRARNVGIQETTGEVVIVTDDCVVSPRWVETMVTHFADNPGLGAVVAPVVAEATWSDDGWTPTYEPAEELLIREPADLPISGMMGANMAFRRTALERIGGFDELLGPGAPLFAADDVDAVYRVVVADLHAAVKLEPSVEHLALRRRATGDDSRHLRLAYRSIGAYYGKHIRAFDVAALRNFLRQVFRTSTKAPTNAVRNRGQVPHAMPDPDLLLAAAERLGVQIEASVVVGDSVWDLLAARRARALGVGLLSGGYGQEELLSAGAYRVYQDPSDLLRHLDEVGVRASE